MADLSPREELESLRRREELRKAREQLSFQSKEPEAPPTSQLKSAAQGLAQGATFGFSDEAMAAAKAAIDKLKEGGGTFSGPSTWTDLYNKRIAEEREALGRAREDFPKSYAAGTLGGSLGSNLIPGVGIARGAGLASTLGKAALQGGLTGAGESVGKDQGEILADTAKGAALGAGTQGVFGGIAGLAGKFKPAQLGKFAEERAVKAAVGPNVGMLRQALGIPMKAKPELVKQQIKKVGRDLLDEDIISALSKTEDIGPALSEAAAKYGKEIGDIGTLIDQKVPNAFDPQKISQQILDYAADVEIAGKGEAIQNRLVQEAEKYANMARTQKEYGLPSLGFKNIQKLKNQYPYEKQAADALMSDKDATNKLNQILGQSLEDAAKQAEATGGKDVKGLLKRYQDAKSKYGSFVGTAQASGNEQAKDLMRRVVSPSDYATGIGTGAATALATGNPAAAATGILAAAANKFSRERGSSTAALIADSLAKKLSSSPDFAKRFGNAVMDAAQRGPAAITATHLMLMKNPEYAKEFPSGGPQK